MQSLQRKKKKTEIIGFFQVHGAEVGRKLLNHTQNPTSARNSHENLYNKFHYCNLCKGNDQKLLVDRPTDKQTAAKQYAFVSSKGHTFYINSAYSYLYIQK